MHEIGVAIHCQCGILYPVCVSGSEKHITRCLYCKEIFPRIVAEWIDASQGILSISLNGQNRQQVVFSGRVQDLSLDFCCSGSSSDTKDKTRIVLRPDFQGIDDYIERMRENYLPVFR